MNIEVTNQLLLDPDIDCTALGVWVKGVTLGYNYGSTYEDTYLHFGMGKEVEGILDLLEEKRYLRRTPLIKWNKQRGWYFEWFTAPFKVIEEKKSKK